MINYIVQVLLFQTLFIAMYDLFLAKETFFSKNRFYLITTAVLSFGLPFLRFRTLQKSVLEEYTVLLPGIVLSPQKAITNTVWYQSVNYLGVLFWLGVAVFLLVFSIKLLKIIRLISSHKVQHKKNYKLIFLAKNTKAFSFFNYIFLGDEIPNDKQTKIIAHELVHSQQKHSLDLLFFECLKIIMWFNPLIYIYQKRITLVHEYLSDELVSKSTEKLAYMNNLLSEAFQVEHISFINQFYKKSMLKKRIIMMTKNKSTQSKQVKYLLLVPVLAGMILYTSCSEETSEVNVEQNQDFIEKTEVAAKSAQLSDSDMVPFGIVNVAPAFKDCGTGDKASFSRCMSQFLKNNVNSGLAEGLGLESGRIRVFVLFTITKTGEIVSVKARAPHSILEEEAIRVVNLIPLLIPAENNGEKVAVMYSLPIVFTVE